MDCNVQLAPLPLLKRTQTWPYANSQTQNISGMALILPLKQRNRSNRVRRKIELILTLIAISHRSHIGDCVRIKLGTTCSVT